MAQKRTIPPRFTLAEWLEARGIPPERVDKITAYASWTHDLDQRGYFDIRLEHDDYPGWTFTLDLAEGGGVWGVRVRLDRSARDNGDTVTRRRLRDLPLGDLALAARAKVALDVELSGMASPALLSRYRCEIGEERQHRGKRVPDDVLLEAMRAYMAAVNAGGATKEAAAAFGCSKSTMDDYRAAAISRGLFRSHGRGIPGGQLIPKENNR
jgi:hypothetical protein